MQCHTIHPFVHCIHQILCTKYGFRMRAYLSLFLLLFLFLFFVLPQSLSYIYIISCHLYKKTIMISLSWIFDIICTNWTNECELSSYNNNSHNCMNITKWQRHHWWRKSRHSKKMKTINIKHMYEYHSQYVHCCKDKTAQQDRLMLILIRK